jgi:hypothetical protein
MKHNALCIVRRYETRVNVSNSASSVRLQDAICKCDVNIAEEVFTAFGLVITLALLLWGVQ